MVKAGDIVRFRSDVKIIDTLPGTLAIVLNIQKRWSYVDDEDFTYVNVMFDGVRGEWPADAFEGFEHGLFDT
jgi:hypothetical protein